MRADAQRNRDRIVEVARQVFKVDPYSLRYLHGSLGKAVADLVFRHGDAGLTQFRNAKLERRLELLEQVVEWVSKGTVKWLREGGLESAELVDTLLQMAWGDYGYYGLRKWSGRVELFNAHADKVDAHLCVADAKSRR